MLTCSERLEVTCLLPMNGAARVEDNKGVGKVEEHVEYAKLVPLNA